MMNTIPVGSEGSHEQPGTPIQEELAVGRTPAQSDHLQCSSQGMRDGQFARRPRGSLAQRFLPGHGAGLAAL